ncbi:MAG: hypothetical protein HKN51_16995 [Saprospiraceae bacterium]|nr:hypothetical protein [Saprospiraceae bacterium]
MKHLICILCLTLWACNTEEMDEMIPTPVQKFGDLQVEVYNCIDPPNCQTVDPILGANVFIYNTELAQSQGINEARFGQTDFEGKVRFTRLDSFIVYITVIQDSLINTSFERVPEGSVGFHTVLFSD